MKPNLHQSIAYYATLVFIRVYSGRQSSLYADKVNRRKRDETSVFRHETSALRSTRDYRWPRMPNEKGVVFVGN